MLLCAFPYLDNEAMSYLKSNWDGWKGKKRKKKRVKLAEREKKKSHSLPLAPGSLSSLTVSCNINMSEQRSRAYHADCNNRRRLVWLPSTGRRRRAQWEYPSFSPSGLNSQPGRPRASHCLPRGCVWFGLCHKRNSYNISVLLEFHGELSLPW